jgi:hypothetical protein
MLKDRLFTLNNAFRILVSIGILSALGCSKRSDQKINAIREEVQKTACQEIYETELVLSPFKEGADELNMPGYAIREKELKSERCQKERQNTVLVENACNIQYPDIKKTDRDTVCWDVILQKSLLYMTDDERANALKSLSGNTSDESDDE